MATERIEVYTSVVQEKTFPSWLRGKGYFLLVGEFIPHWPGPEPEGKEVCHVCTMHTGSTVDTPGVTLWFLLPKGQKPDLPVARLQEAAHYVFERLGRKAHTPKTGMNNVIILAPKASGLN